jgi:hypothetical protein
MSMIIRGGIPCAGLLLLAACVDGEVSNRPLPQPAPPKRQYVVVVDLSGSISAQERGTNEQLLAEFTRTLTYGDRLVVMDAHARGRKDTRPPVVLELSDTEFGGEPTEDDESTKSQTVALFQPRIQEVLAAPQAEGTDLFATFHSVSDRVIQAADRTTTLVLMSDMLQCASGICMEDGAIPDPAYIASLQSSGMLPDLSGTCVVVVGADASTPAGQRVREFWIAYFKAAGAELRREKYSYQLTSAKNLACQSRPEAERPAP